VRFVGQAGCGLVVKMQVHQFGHIGSAAPVYSPWQPATMAHAFIAVGGIFGDSYVWLAVALLGC
jgi:hypothetical protein